MVWVLLVLLLISLAANGYQYYRWNAYRTKPAGTHSHTGMMPKIDRDQILKDREMQRRKDPDGGGEPPTDVFRGPS